MFGLVRFFLACLVVLTHLSGIGIIHHYGFYAVRGFFVLSGFIITAALNEVYHFDGGRFWTNRLLRLLPPLYIVCAVTAFFVLLAPTQAAAYMKYWQPGDNTRDVFMNLLVLPLQFREPHFRFSPAAWSLAVELEMYVLLWLVIARREAFAAAAVGIGIVYHLYCLDAGLGLGARYFNAPSALLSFAIGALVYFLRQRGAFAVDARFGFIALALWTINMVAAGTILPESYIYGSGYYIATFLFAFVVAGLASYKPGQRLAGIDMAFGEIAYPLFLVQWLAGFVAALAFFPGTWRGWMLTVAATPVLLGGALGLAKLNQLMIEPFRRRVRAGAVRDAAMAALASASGADRTAGASVPT